MGSKEHVRSVIRARRAGWLEERRTTAIVEPSGNDTTSEITQAVAEDMDARWDQ